MLSKKIGKRVINSFKSFDLASANQLLFVTGYVRVAGAVE